MDSCPVTHSQDGRSHLGRRARAARLREPALETSRSVEPGPSEPPLHRLCLRPPQFHLPLTPQASFSFLPQQGPSSDFHQTCRTNVAQVPPEGINITPLISPSPLSHCASPWLQPAFVSGGTIHCVWKCYCN